MLKLISMFSMFGNQQNSNSLSDIQNQIIEIGTKARKSANRTSCIRPCIWIPTVDYALHHHVGTNNMRAILLNEAEKRTRAVPQGHKLLTVTGDFHNYDDGDYTDTTGFLTGLVEKMGLRMERDVFVVPGNHDVGNEQTLAPLLGSDKRWKQHQENTRSAMEQRGVTKENLEERLEAFLPDCNFVKALGLYSDSDPLYPATAHVRCWEGAAKLNLLHLNTALIYDGHNKGDQLADVASASDDDNTWRGVQGDIPALALGHNHFCDLKKKTRNQLLPVFIRHNVSAYLCGDALKQKENTTQDVSFRDEENRPPHLTSVYCVPCPSIIDVGNRIHPMRGDNA